MQYVFVLSFRVEPHFPTAGARQVATGLSIAKQRNERVFVTSMCIGSGMGMAAVFASEH